MSLVKYDNQTLWIRSDVLGNFTTIDNQPLDLATLPSIDPDAGFSGNTEFANAQWELQLIRGSNPSGGNVY